MHAARPRSEKSIAGNAAASVLPSPVAISAIAPLGQGHAGQKLRIEKDNAMHATGGFQHQGEGRNQSLIPRNVAAATRDPQAFPVPGSPAPAPGLRAEMVGGRFQRAASSSPRSLSAAAWIASKTFCGPLLPHERPEIRGNVVRGKGGHWAPARVEDRLA